MSTNESQTTKGKVTMRGKYLNPKADLIFKLVFGEHPDLVMSLLNALLPLPEDGQIESVEYLTPEMVPENPAKKQKNRHRLTTGCGGYSIGFQEKKNSKEED